MERNGYMMKLDAWRQSSRRKPLVLEGARQVGKTWLMREFARTRFENVVYARFDKDSVLRGIFARDFDVNRIVGDLEVLYRTRVKDGGTILLFDEIQACKNALTSLKYFCEDRPDLHVMAAGSLLGLTYREDDIEDSRAGEESTGFPVGKVNTIRVFPLTFNEFLIAMGEARLAEEIRNRNWRMLEDLNEAVAAWLRRYYVVGGMPEAVAAYAETQNFIDARAVHREILSGYLRDISKHAPKSDMRKIEMCWRSIPAQLARENKKFLYSVVKPGARAREYENALNWLRDADIVSKVNRISKPPVCYKNIRQGSVLPAVPGRCPDHFIFRAST